MLASIVAFILLLALVGGVVFNSIEALLGLVPRWVPLASCAVTLGIVGVGTLAFLYEGVPNPLMGIPDLHPALLWCAPIATIIIMAGGLITLYPELLGFITALFIIFVPNPKQKSKAGE